MEESRRIEEEEIDLLALLQTLWEGRKTVIKFAVIFALVGLFIAIFSPKEYTATTVMVPNASEKGGGGKLGGLAAMAGINIGGSSNNDVIAPALYPKIIKSIPFKKELLETQLKVAESENPVSFFYYFTELYNPGLLAVVKKYTIGLPGLVLGTFSGSVRVVERNNDNSLLFISQEEKALFRRLEGLLSLTVNDKDGYITLTASMPEAIAAAQLAEQAQQLLQHYIITGKSKKAREKLDFVEKRFAEKEEEFRNAEYALANFQDRNKNVISAKAATREKHLQAEYNLVYGVYSELAKQIEQQKLQVKEDTPTFTIIEPVSVPLEKSKPRRVVILAIWLFLGLVVGAGVVLGKDLIRSFKNKGR